LEDEQVYSTEAASKPKDTDDFTPREAKVGFEHANSCTPIDYTLVSLASKIAMLQTIYPCAEAVVYNAYFFHLHAIVKRLKTTSKTPQTKNG
jgi:hypothetical protein